MEADNLDPKLQEVLQRIRQGAASRPEDADLLEHHLTRDSLVPSVRNRAAWNQHAKHYGNAGIWVHADLNNFGVLNKQHGEDFGDDAIKHFGGVFSQAGKTYAARIWRRGGDEFDAWLLRPEDAEGFAKSVQTALQQNQKFPLTVSMGVGYGRHQAEDAMREAKSRKSETPQTQIVSRISSVPPLGWQPAEEAVKSVKRQGLRGGPDAATSGMPGEPDAEVKHRYPGSLGKAEAQTPVHPIFSGKPFVMMSGENALYPGKRQGHEALKEELLQRQLPFEETQGFCGKPERSFVVYGLPQTDASQLARDFGQESYVHHDGQQARLIYANGPHADFFHPSRGHKLWADTPPKDEGWTRLTDQQTGRPFYMSYDLDWDTKHPITKLGGGSFPHGRAWHNQDQAADLPPKQPQPVQKAEGEAGAQPATAADQPWGMFQPGTKSHLWHYNLAPFSSQINDLARSHGYRFRYMDENHLPDLKQDGHHQRTLWIWHPSNDGHTPDEIPHVDAWRRLHELSHALTLPDIIARYGDGPRLGPLGQRTPEEAKRNIAWEHAVAGKQRELAESMGHHISDEDFNKERNTLMADVVHKAIHGHGDNPSNSGFVPHGHEVPIEKAFEAVDKHVAPPPPALLKPNVKT